MPSKTIVAMLCITVCEVTALLIGFDGVLLKGVIAVLAGLGGYAIHRVKK